MGQRIGFAASDLKKINERYCQNAVPPGVDPNVGVGEPIPNGGVGPGNQPNRQPFYPEYPQYPEYGFGPGGGPGPYPPHPYPPPPNYGGYPIYPDYGPVQFPGSRPQRPNRPFGLFRPNRRPFKRPFKHDELNEELEA